MSSSIYGGSTAASAAGAVAAANAAAAGTSIRAGNSQDNSNSALMYRLGDYVYFENSSSGHYAIRRIEELTKTPTGAVEARVMCFFRRSELSPTLLSQADKHHWGDSNFDSCEPDSDDEDTMVNEKEERRQFKLREVFLSRQVETLPATLIRGKCSVTLLSEVETVSSYTARDDAFFYALVYDPHQKTLVADRGEIRIGAAYQAQVPQLLKEDEDYNRDESVLEEFVWNPDNELTKDDIEKFLIISRSVGTFARALDCSSSVKQPSLHMSAAAASRDVTLFHAYNLMHKFEYSMEKAVKSLVPTTGPVLCRDEMEDWSASEANLFEEAMEKYGKEFNDIKKDFLPWKSMKNIIEYFFMWKTTDRYVQQKRLKAIENESKLKQVYVPAYTNKTSRLTGSNGEVILRGKDCDAYPNLSKYSWMAYKKYGKFMSATITDDAFILDKSAYPNMTAARLAQMRPGLIIEPGSPVKAAGSGGKTRAAFYLRTTPMSRAARRLCGSVARLHHAARKPGKLVDMKAIKADAQPKLAKMDEKKIRWLNAFTVKERSNMEVVVKGRGQKDIEKQEWLVLTLKADLPQPEKEFYPRPAKRPDGSYIYDKLDAAAPAAPAPGGPRGGAQLLYKKRAFEETTPSSTATATATVTATATPTTQATAAKVPRVDTSGRGHIPNVVQPKGRIATLSRIGGGHRPVRRIISWMDAPDDVYYKATSTTKRLRKRMPVTTLRKAARKPFKKTLVLPNN